MGIKKVYSSLLRESYRDRLNNIKILIIHQNIDAALLLQRMLEALGFSRVAIALNAQDALESMRAEPASIVLMDAILDVQPIGMDAFFPSNKIRAAKFVHRLRHSPSSPNRFMPMMMLVPGRENALVLEARDAGVNEMVQIPLTGENFCHRMVALFDRPRHFITAEHYKGPCRRLRPAAPPQAERRIRDVRIVPFQEAMA